MHGFWFVGVCSIAVLAGVGECCFLCATATRRRAVIPNAGLACRICWGSVSDSLAGGSTHQGYRLSGATSCKVFGLHILHTVQANLATIYRPWCFFSITYRAVRSGSACAGSVPLTSHNTCTQACADVAARRRCALR
ncbi:hypothetical protein HDN1F_29670 [gamma proteobacterium HdN1]|nr:hypothetical protein HDN1F_29670 [gamma proteobacterium HdN1]